MPRRLPSLRSRLLLLVLLPLLPTLAFCAWLMAADYQEDVEDAQRNAALATRALAFAVDQKLSLSEAVLRGLSKSSALAAGRLADFHAEAQAVAQATGLVNILLVRSDGEHVLNTLKPWGVALPPIPVDAAWQRVFSQARAVARLSMSALLGHPVVAVAVPIELPGRGVPFALVAVLAQSQVQDLLVQAALPPSWVSAIVDSELRVAARSRDPRLYVGQRITPSLAAVLEQPDRANEGFFESATLDGQTVHTLYGRGPAHGWTVVVGIPQAEFTQPLQRTLAELGALGLLLLLAVLVLDWWWGRRLGRDVDALVELSAQVGGSSPHAIPPMQFAEADRIARAVMQADADLALARQALERKSADLREFAHAAAHDLHTPLRSVHSLLDVLRLRRGDALGPEGRELLARAAQAVERLHRMTRDLLMFATVDQADPAFLPVDLGRVVAEALKRLDAQVQAVQARVDVEPLPTVPGDTGQLLQLMVNLLGNALRFHGPAPCHIRVGAQPEPGGGWRIWVMDNGIGIAPEHREQVFGLFKRLGAGTPVAGGGTGIGLALCRRIVEHHGGHIGVESLPGQGSTFFFTLPSGGGDAGSALV